MFFEWSPMRSIDLAMNTTSSAAPIVRGSSIMKLISWRITALKATSMSSSSSTTLAAALTSRRANASSDSRSIFCVPPAIRTTSW